MSESLHPLEARVLRTFSSGDVITHENIQERLSLDGGQSHQVVSLLIGRGYLSVKDSKVSLRYERTAYANSLGGSIEHRILQLARAQSVRMADLPELLQLEKKEIGPACGHLIKLGAIRVEQFILLGDDASQQLIADLDEFIHQGQVDAEELSSAQKQMMDMVGRKRGAGAALFRIVEKEHHRYVCTAEGTKVQESLKNAPAPDEEIGALTSDMLKNNAWQGKSFRTYDVKMPPARVLLGRSNPYVAYLQWVKDKLVALGFTEFSGPLVESDFWNSDALFMPQFHSARDIHDVYTISQPTHVDEAQLHPYLSKVAATHEQGGESGGRGWQYKFDIERARRLVLRSQGTVLSAKTLPHAEVPGRYFGIARCFRHDQVDATHLPDFYQVEGIVLGEHVNLQTLLGMLKIFAEEIAGATEVRYVPGYFPFTEPSVEVHIRHPELGWFELGGSGIFRPEVTKPLGVEVPVLAWGLGIDRMALFHLGLRDLRDLFSCDIDVLRLRRSHAKD